MKGQCIFNVCIPSNIAGIRAVVDELLQNLRKGYGRINDCILFEIRVILNEVLVNAVRHGNKEDEKKLVKIDASITADGVMRIVVEDEGSGYNFGSVCSCGQSLCNEDNVLEMCESGRGIMIVKGLCDSVKVNKKGNKIIINKSVAKI